MKSEPEPEATESVAERVHDALDTLERLVANPALLADVDEDTHARLRAAAGRVAQPDPRARRELTKEVRRRRKAARKAADEALLHQTGIRAKRRAPVFETPLLEAPVPAGAELADEPAPTVEDARVCYVCKAAYRELHHFYDQMCPPCAELNWTKRNQTADLRGRVALVTGARVKIGYQAAIKLLRAGAHVVVATRFPRDAAARYAREDDFATWADRLEIHGLDLRHTPSVDAFARHLAQTLPRLDFIINNACQTVRRPAGFYGHLMEAERRSTAELPEAEVQLLASYESMREGTALAVTSPAVDERAVGLTASAELSQLPLLAEDRDPGVGIFPAGALDADLQQIDLRGHNSWRLTLAEVPAVELLEVHLVNAVAPFVLNARLKPLMVRSGARDMHIVNVSAMEGQFYRRHKTDKHPHTNMAKASLNMMTRTSAADYVRDGIHMNSVDTGWVTDEDPAELAARKVEIHGFHPPLDIVDGAARIVAPIFDGILTGEHVWGLFLKDYAPTDW